MTADEIITRVKDLPVVSETARKLTIQLNQPDLHREALVHTLRCDNVLTAKLLRVCNSADSGACEPVASLDQALLLLGDNAIFRIVCAIGFGSSLGLTAPGYDTEANGLWSHSLTTAVAAEYLAKVENYGNFAPPTAFTAGLLHDIGKVVMQRIMTPKDRADIRNKISSQVITRVEAEKAVLGADHCEIGECLLRRWSLPEPILEAVAHHHFPVTKPDVQLSAIVYFANFVAHLSGAGSGWETHAAQAKNTTAQVLGIDVEQVDRTIAGMDDAMEAMPQLKAAA